MDGNRLCCCIPDQSTYEERCQKLAYYQLWFGDNPSPDDYTESCLEHVGDMLDDSDCIMLVRIKDVE